jgi:hypothetical protein
MSVLTESTIARVVHAAPRLTPEQTQMLFVQLAPS